jgi:hypothetical protein
VKLADLRKITVKKQLRIRFPLSNGMECVLNEHGVAQVPALRATTGLNLEEELARAQNFLVEPAGAPAQEKPKARSYTREELSALAAPASREAPREEHED